MSDIQIEEDSDVLDARGGPSARRVWPVALVVAVLAVVAGIWVARDSETVATAGTIDPIPSFPTYERGKTGESGMRVGVLSIRESCAYIVTPDGVAALLILPSVASLDEGPPASVTLDGESFIDGTSIAVGGGDPLTSTFPEGSFPSCDGERQYVVGSIQHVET